MRSLVLGLMLPLLGIPAFAQSVFRSEGLTIFFYSTPCEYPLTIEKLKELGEVKRASVVVDGRRIGACFIRDEDGDYLLIDQLGNAGWIPGKAVQVGA